MCPRLILVFLSALGLCACGDVQEGPPVTEQERKAGAEIHAQLLAEFGGPYEQEEAAYVRSLGESLAAEAGLSGQCTFTLVNSDIVNAFAVPGCYVYVTRGLVSIVNSEAELASVLGHEMGHILGNHVERQQQRSIWRELGVMAVGVLTGSERLTRMAGGAAALFTLRHSRKHEYEADDLGLKLLRQAGYDPFAAADMLRALGDHERFQNRTRGRDEASKVPEWSLTHPLTENRVERLGAALDQTGLADDELPEHESRYLDEVDGLLFGDDPEQGFVIGRRFAHPGMRIAFEAPTGFTLTNSPAAVGIEGPDGLRGEFAGGRLPAGGLRAYAQALLGSLLEGASPQIGAGEERTINGFPVLVVPARVDTAHGSARIDLAVYDAGGGDAYHFVLASEGGASPAGFEALAASFRRLAPGEAASLRPRRIRVVPVPAGGGYRALVSTMASEHPLEHFLVLNGLAPEAPVPAGRRVKIVVQAN